MKPWTLWIALLISCLVSMAACSPSSRPTGCDTDADCESDQACLAGECQAVGCKSDADCEATQECFEYACRERSGCTADGQCPVGQICAEGTCTQGCRQDADCPNAQLCIAELGPNGTCVECRLDADCADGGECIGNQCRTDCQSSSDCPDGVCEPISGTCVECLQDIHCDSGLVCETNLCVAGCRVDGDCPAEQRCDPVAHQCLSAECVSVDDCQLGQVCVDGTCLPGCGSDRDCPDGQRCLVDEGENGTCAECLADAECDQGLRCVNFICSEACETNADCVQGLCHPQARVCVECFEDGHCPAGSYCAETICEEGCRTDVDCGAGTICEQGQCQTGCRQDGQCGPGQICDQGECRPGCRDDADCQNGSCDLVNWQCVGFDCNTKDDCQLGQVCIDHVCVPGCEFDRDCPAPLVCSPAAGSYGQCVDCNTDADCLDPDFPTCLSHSCEPECWDDGDCAFDQVCIALHCQALPDECVMFVEPAQSVDFGAVPVGASLSVEFTLANHGGQDCSVQGIELRDGLFSTGDFQIGQGPQAPFTLGPVEAVVLEVIFVPADGGDHLNTLWISTDDPDLQIGMDDWLHCGGLFGQVPGQACIPLTGQGASLDVQAVPAALAFGQTQVGCGSADLSVRFYNLGATVNVNDIYLEEAFDNNFDIRQAPAVPFSIAADGSFEVRVRFQPGSTGFHENALLIFFDDGNLPPLRVLLSGQGVIDSQTLDVFHLPDDVRVDVLWVVDNSGSMGEEQQALADNFSQFIGFALNLGVNFHVGVVSTEVNDPEVDQGNPPRDVLPGVLVHAPQRPRFITPETVDPEGAFADNVRLGTCCSDEQEAGLQSSWMAMSPPLLYDPQANGGFLRESAKLYVIYVSDESDQSQGPVDFYVDYFSTLKGTSELITLSAICGDLPSGCSGNMGDAMEAPRYHDAMNQTEGLFQSICQADWSGLMYDLGLHAFEPIRLYPLSRPAAQGSIQLAVDGQAVPEASAPYAPDGYTYVPGDNAIWFGDGVLPATGATIEASYTALCL